MTNKLCEIFLSISMLIGIFLFFYSFITSENFRSAFIRKLDTFIFSEYSRIETFIAAMVILAVFFNIISANLLELIGSAGILICSILFIPSVIFKKNCYKTLWRTIAFCISLILLAFAITYYSLIE